MKQVRLDLLCHKTDLYKETTCVMKQVGLALLRHETDLYQKDNLYHETGRA